MSNYDNLNHWRYQAREEEDKKARMNMGIGNFLQDFSSSEAEEAAALTRGYEPTQSVKDYSQPLYCKICHVDCNSDSMLETHLNGKNHKKKLKQLGKEEDSTGSTSKKVIAATPKSAESIDDAELAALRKQRSLETFEPNNSATFGKINTKCSVC